MASVLLDTHVWVWSLKDERRISIAARRAIENADTIVLSAISIFEIAQKVRIGKWPEMAGLVNDLAAALDQQSGVLASVNGRISLRAGLLDWEHRDPFDRLIAATALSQNLSLVSADAAFDLVLDRIW